MRRLFFAAAIWLCFAQPAAAQIDASGVGQFWRTADRIAAGDSLSSTDWDAFFSHPGYRITQEAGQRRPVIEFCMQAVFAPGSDVVAALQNRPNPTRRAELYADTCAHMANARAQRTAINAMIESGAIEAMLADAELNAAPWLPAGAMAQGQPPHFYVLLFEPQGFGRPGEIVIDALYTMQKPREENVQFIGHELHHAYREAYQRVTWAEGAEPLMQQLDRFVHEGSASMIDKAPHFRAGTIPFGEPEDFLAIIRDTPERLARIDAVLTGLTPTAEGYASAADLIDEQNPGGGHLNGVFMAITIEDAIGRPALIAALTGPVAFFDAYQRAARVRGIYALSKPAMTALHRAAGPPS